MAFGNNFDFPVDHFDGGLIVDCVPRYRHASSPFLCFGHGIGRQTFMIVKLAEADVNHT
jgi:hypothetical protein